MSFFCQVHSLYLKSHEMDKIDFWEEGVIGRYFYRMVDGALPQWIRAYPEPDAPRTGEGLFPGEVIEVVQVLSHGGIVFLRIADGRGYVDSLYLVVCIWFNWVLFS